MPNSKKSRSYLNTISKAFHDIEITSRLTSQNKEEKTNKRTITDVKHSGGKASETKPTDPKQQGVGEHVTGRSSSSTKSSPLPVIVLVT